MTIALDTLRERTPDVAASWLVFAAKEGIGDADEWTFDPAPAGRLAYPPEVDSPDYADSTDGTWAWGAS